MFLPLRIDAATGGVLDRLEDDRRETYIKHCVHALIILGQERAPIKRADLNKLVFPNLNYRNISTAIVQAANVELNKIFGMRLFEVDDKPTATKYFLLVNSNSTFAKHMNPSSSMCQELTILYFILMDLFVAPDEKKSEEELLENITQLEPNNEKMKNFLDSLVKKNYLNVEKRSQDSSKLYSWGPRAIAEVEPENFFNRFLELVGDTSDKEWPDLRKRIDRLKNIPNR